jgi:DNA primase
MQGQDFSSPPVKRSIVERLKPLLNALSSRVQRKDYQLKAVSMLGIPDSDLLQADAQQSERPAPRAAPEGETPRDERDLFSATEMTLGLFLCYPGLRHLLPELIAPEQGLAAVLYKALQSAPLEALTLAAIPLPQEFAERASVLALYCDQHEFTDWSESMAIREIRKHCKRSNRELLQAKQKEITKRLLEARRDGKISEEVQLQNQYQQVLRLMKMAS